jgi:hypothetical protein
MNPEFQMHGITFVIATPSGDQHALPFKVVLQSGKLAEVQRSLNASMTAFEVVTELRLLANMIEDSVTLSARNIDYPAAVTGLKV